MLAPYVLGFAGVILRKCSFLLKNCSNPTTQDLWGCQRNPWVPDVFCGQFSGDMKQVHWIFSMWVWAISSAWAPVRVGGPDICAISGARRAAVRVDDRPGEEFKRLATQLEDELIGIVIDLSRLSSWKIAVLPRELC